MTTSIVITAAGVPIAAGGGIVLGCQCGCEELRRERDALARLAYTDDLTQLPTRGALHRVLDSNTGREYGLAFLDVDHFKQINDNLGHEIGDYVLVQLAMRLRELADTHGWFVARLGGDEFAVIFPDVSDLAAATERAWLIRESSGEPTVLNGHLILSWATVGVAVAAADESPSSVRRRADAAMYKARRGDVGVGVFDPRVDAVPDNLPLRPSAKLRDLPVVRGTEVAA